MGGLFIMATVLLTYFGLGLITDSAVQIIITSLIVFGLIGALDDYYKIAVRTGITARTKFILQWVFALAIQAAMVWYVGIDTTITVPLLGYIFDLRYWYILWGAFVIVACSNAVNLTDGLDGLAASCLIPQFLLFAGIAVYENMTSVAVASLVIAGSIAGFLVYNRYPARVFMGDVGALSLGAVYAVIALLLKYELLIVIAGIVFVCEELSVMLQVAWYKKFKTRLFKMAPLHHHFELSGWHEVSITRLFAAVTTIACVIVWFFFVS